MFQPTQTPVLMEAQIMFQFKFQIIQVKAFFPG